MNASSQPRKQRKLIHNVPMHRRQKMMTTRLSEELREEYSRKSFIVHKGDTVELLRGDFKGHRGKVEKIDLLKRRLHVEGVTVQKSDGSDRFYPVHPSKVMIVKMDLKDEMREKTISKETEKG